MRETGPYFKRIPPGAEPYVKIAETILGAYKRQLGLLGLTQGTITRTLQDGTVIRVGRFGNNDIVEIKPPPRGQEPEPYTPSPVGIACVPASNTSPDGWGSPFFDDGVPIDPPRGTPDGDDREWVIRNIDNAWRSTRFSSEYGNIDWRGADGTTLSWWGTPSRHLCLNNYEAASPALYSLGSTEPIGTTFRRNTPPARLVSVDDFDTRAGHDLYGSVKIYKGGAEYADLSSIMAIVFGAGEGTQDGQLWLYVIGTNDVVSNRPHSEISYRIPVVLGEPVVGDAELIDSLSLDSQAYPGAYSSNNTTPWAFSPDGLTAVAVRWYYRAESDYLPHIPAPDVEQTNAPRLIRWTAADGFVDTGMGVQVDADAAPETLDYNDSRVGPTYNSGLDRWSASTNTYQEWRQVGDFRIMIAADWHGGQEVYAWIRSQTLFHERRESVGAREFADGGDPTEQDLDPQWYQYIGTDNIGLAAQEPNEGVNSLGSFRWDVVVDLIVSGAYTKTIPLTREYTYSRGTADSAEGVSTAAHTARIWLADNVLDNDAAEGPLWGNVQWMDLRAKAFHVRYLRGDIFDWSATGVPHDDRADYGPNGSALSGDRWRVFQDGTAVESHTLYFGVGAQALGEVAHNIRVGISVDMWGNDVTLSAMPQTTDNSTPEPAIPLVVASYLWESDDPAHVGDFSPSNWIQDTSEVVPYVSGQFAWDGAGRLVVSSGIYSLQRIASSSITGGSEPDVFEFIRSFSSIGDNALSPVQLNSLLNIIGDNPRCSPMGYL